MHRRVGWTHRRLAVGQLINISSERALEPVSHRPGGAGGVQRGGDHRHPASTVVDDSENGVVPGSLGARGLHGEVCAGRDGGVECRGCELAVGTRRRSDHEHPEQLDALERLLWG